jgi:hypothetical protein
MIAIDCSSTWSLDFYDEEVGWHLYVGPLILTWWRCP